jgi:hypothetical protein
MKRSVNFQGRLALGSLTAVAAVLAGVSVARADDVNVSYSATDSGQAAPGGGAFPGSFLVPGTNTSIKIGGFAKGVYIYDMSAMNFDTIGPQGIPVNNGNAAHTMHGATRLQARQSNFSFDVRTPTSYGELDTFILVDFFGSQATTGFGQGNTQNARLVLAYGTLGPFLAGQNLSLWFDGDALGETIDPTASIGLMNGLTNRSPQFRYTYAGAEGISFAGSIEQPQWQFTDNALGAVTANAPGSWQRYPDFVGKGRWDQAWGHVALAGVIKDQEVYSSVSLPGGAGVPRIGTTGWGLFLSGHWNVFGKDTLRGGGMWGRSLGYFLSDMNTVNGYASNIITASNKSPYSYGANASYTHWWTDQLRSTAMVGYSALEKAKGVIVSPTTAANTDLNHLGTTINLIWSPVPQVDVGLEYDWGRRIVSHALQGGGSNSGALNRLEAGAVFKF